MTKIGTREDWLAARTPLLAREKQHTRLADEIAQQRRGLPWVALEKEYRFDTEAGTRTLAELFDGRSQLIVYHFMFGPDYTAGCATCSSTADSFNGVLPHLKARDVTMVCISHAPLEKLLAYRRRMGWSFNWASSYESDFNLDCGVSVARRPASPRQPPAGRHPERRRDRHGHRRLLLRGPRCRHVRPRREQRLPLLLQLRPRNRVPDGLLRDPRPDAQGSRRKRRDVAAPTRRVRRMTRREIDRLSSGRDLRETGRD